MKKSYALFLCAAVFLLLGCSSQINTVKKTARTETQTFNAGKIEDVTELIFGFSDIKVDEILADATDQPEITKYGPISKILPYVNLKVKNVTEETIEFEVTAPDMINVFNDLKNDQDIESLDEDALLQYIEEYAKNSQSNSISVVCDYAYINEDIKINYKTKEFINALTGGLLEAYQELYRTLLDAYESEGE